MQRFCLRLACVLICSAFSFMSGVLHPIVDLMFNLCINNLCSLCSYVPIYAPDYSYLSLYDSGSAECNHKPRSPQSMQQLPHISSPEGNAGTYAYCTHYTHCTHGDLLAIGCIACRGLSLAHQLTVPNNRRLLLIAAVPITIV